MWHTVKPLACGTRWSPSHAAHNEAPQFTQRCTIAHARSLWQTPPQQKHATYDTRTNAHRGSTQNTTQGHMSTGASTQQIIQGQMPTKASTKRITQGHVSTGASTQQMIQGQMPTRGSTKHMTQGHMPTGASTQRPG